MKVVQLWVDPKTVFELDMEPKNSPLEPQKLKKKQIKNWRKQKKEIWVDPKEFDSRVSK